MPSSNIKVHQPTLAFMFATVLLFGTAGTTITQAHWFADK